MSIDKTASPSIYAAVGDVVAYSYLVVNTGNVTLFDITVTDDKATVTCPDTSAGLAPLGTITCEASYTITQADLDGGSVTNSAYAQAGDTQSPPDSETVTAEQKPALSIDKSATESSYAQAGDVLHYSYLVTNSGNVTLHDAITVTDDKATATCPALPAGGLAPGASITCSASYTVTQADLDAGQVTNVASAKCGTTTSNSDTVTVPATQIPHVTLTKTATANFSDPVKVGDSISYEMVATNDGNVTLNNVSISDALLPGLTCTPAQPAMLAPSEKLSCSGSYALTQADIDAGQVANTAYATSKLPGGGDGPGGQDSKEVPVPQAPALSIDKTATPATYAAVGDVISYSYLVKNTGNVTLHDAITVTDDKATATCPALPAGGLAPGASITCSASYTVTQADLDAGSVKNTATAKAGDTQSQPDSQTVTAEQAPALLLSKSATPATYGKVGDVIAYSYQVKNTGNVTLSGPFSVTDDKAADEACPATPASLAPGASINCTASYKITQADLDAGKVTNLATATARFGTQTVTSNEATATVTAARSPAVTLNKSASPTLYSRVGDVIAYTLVAKNTGNLTLHDVSISDPKLGTLTCTPNQPATLAPGASLTCKGSYTIQQPDLVAGQPNQVTNTATVNGKGPQDQPVSATASAAVYQQTGVMLPTQTTCKEYAAGPSAWPAMYDAFTYQVKGGKISSLAPGVIFYYNTITAPGASFTLEVVEGNSLAWKPMLVQDLGQAILYSSDCSKADGVTVTASGTNPYTVRFTVTGATPGATYYIGIKYSPDNLVGQAVKNPYPTSVYAWSTTGYLGSDATISVTPKK